VILSRDSGISGFLEERLDSYLFENRAQSLGTSGLVRKRLRKDIVKIPLTIAYPV